jgi:hypothetical protein
MTLMRRLDEQERQKSLAWRPWGKQEPQQMANHDLKLTLHYIIKIWPSLLKMTSL